MHFSCVNNFCGMKYFLASKAFCSMKATSFFNDLFIVLLIVSGEDNFHPENLFHSIRKRMKSRRQNIPKNYEKFLPCYLENSKTAQYSPAMLLIRGEHTNKETIFSIKCLYSCVVVVCIVEEIMQFRSDWKKVKVAQKLFCCYFF